MKNHNNQDPKNILISISSITGGGAEHVVENLCTTLNDRYQIYCGYFKECRDRGDVMIEKGVKVVRLSNPDETKTDYFSFLQMRKFCKDHDISLIHAHDIHAMMNAVLVKLTMPRMKVVYTFHYGNYPNIDKKKYYFEKLFGAFVDRLIAVGTRQAKTIRETYNLSEKRVQTLYNGVDALKSVAEHVSEKDDNERKLVFGSISTLIEQKGIPLLLEAVEILHNRYPNRFKLVIAGDGPLKNEFIQQCKDKGIDQVVEFLGWVRDASESVLPGFDVFVQSSKWEAMSMVILEAMSASKPIVATNVGENAVVIENEKSGLIIPANNVPELVDKMEKMLLDPELRKQLGNEAKRRFEENFTMQKMADNYAKLFDTLIG
ncbi:MAG: glycosyltransferase family 4 protein [Candidatus Thiodiazotropha sp.]